jgi:hypothetical protein
MARYKWDREAGDFVRCDDGREEDEPLIRRRTLKVLCVPCGYVDADRVVVVGRDMPLCPHCGDSLTESKDFVAPRFAVRSDYIPGGFVVGGQHYDKRSDMKRDIARLEAIHGGKVELHNPSESQRAAERDKLRSEVERRRRARGISTDDVRRVDAERKAARAAGSTNAEVLHKPASALIKGR